MINRYQVMIISGILIILASSIPIYYSHWESAISYNHVNATTCIEVLDNIINGSLTGNRINEVIKSLDQSLLISIEVNIEYTNGSSVTYGYYTPIGASGVAIAPMISGNIEIFGRTHCAYMGRDYVINVFIGQYVTALYLFSIGIVLIIVGFVMIALGDYLKDKRNRRRFGQ
ncbi:hypothetical protein [Vulcanisaeta sp. JCM 16159]|uniref:hypothetical protein n=1 Tax=Vulcanisaeta sp. JCM 16159 TaxID=1295371 RepID=UPI0006D0590C|nr:hypothetical protein [Vulcanisaeta sp. JCM 16159]